MNDMKKLFFVMFGFIIVLSSCENEDVKLNGVRISPNQVTMYLYVFPNRQPEKDSPPRKLYVHFYPDNATNQEIRWGVSSEEVITITEDGIVSPVALGEAYAIVYQGDHALDSCKVTVAPFVRISINLLVNTGFEIGTGGNTSLSNEDIPGWEALEREWFEEFYGTTMVSAYNWSNSTRVNSGVGAWWGNNGGVFSQTFTHVDPPYTFLEGENICRVGSGGGSTGGFYQIVRDLTPGEIYKLGGRTAARAGNATDIPNFKDGKLMILSPDGKDLYAEFPVDYLNGDGAEGLTHYNIPGGNVHVTFFVAEKHWIAPEGVDRVRIQYAQRNFTAATGSLETTGLNTPIICWDEMFFQLLVEEGDEDDEEN